MALGSQKMKPSLTGCLSYPADGERKSINSELWHACAGPLVSLPPVGSLVYYFPQGHSEQVAASTQKAADTHIPNYPNLPSQLICQLHNVTLHADVETDEVYAQMTLQPVNTYDKDAILASDLGPKQSKQPTEFFCKTLTASDTSTHGGFSVPRRAAEKVFPPLDFSMQPPAQELVARDLHDNVWTFRHIYRGQPKRHLLTTGWSVFVSAKRLVAGDSVLFTRDEKAQLLLGIRRANRQQTAMPSSVLSSDSMHIGVLAAAAHAAANHSPFTVFYNPRASPSEFVVPLAKYNKALYGTQVSVGMRFRMMFETDESGIRRYMGTITGISDLDPVRWPNSQWRNLQVGWDESSAGERQNRASIWEIETVATPYFLCPPIFRLKRPRQPGMLGEETELESTIKRSFPWIREENVIGNFQNSISGVGLEQWIGLQQRPEIVNPAMQLEYYRSMAAAALQEFRSNEASKELCTPQHVSQAHQIQFNVSQQQEHQHQPQISWEQSQQQIHYQQQQLPLQQLPLRQNVPVQQLQQQLHQHFPLQQLQQPQQQHTQLQQSQQQQQHSTLHPLKQLQPLQQLQQPVPQVIQLQHQPLQQLRQQPLQQLQQLQQQQLPLHQLQQQLAPLAQQKQLPMPSQQFQQQQHQLRQPLTPQQHNHNQSPESHLHSQQELQLQQSILHQQSAQQQSQQQQVEQPSPQQQHGYKQSPEHHFHIQQQLQLQPPTPPTQLTELEAQLLRPSSSRSQVAGSMPVPARSRSGFTESDVSFCSTSTSTNSYPLQNILPRTHQGTNTSEEKTQYANVLRRSPISTQGATLISNLVQEPPASLWFSSIREPDQPMLQGTPNIQSRQNNTLETTSSPGASFSLTEVNAGIQQSLPTLPSSSPSFWFRNISQDSDAQADPRNNFLFGTNIESPLADPSTSSPLLTRGFSTGKDAPCQVSAESMLSSFSTSKDLQPQISSASMLGSQSLAVPDLPVNSDVASTVELDDSDFLHRGSWQQHPTPVRTYTKVYKLGSVGRSIDVTRYKNYDELRCELARMFGLEGQLEDPKRSGWQLVFVDNENDILLVGDDPWEEFVSCVRCIKILSPYEVLQMSQEGMELLNNTPLQLQTSSCSDDGNMWRDPRYQSSTNPSSGSLDH